MPKYLDEIGVKHLWNKISMKDYPNNETLIAVLNAIDTTKADKDNFLLYRTQELTDEQKTQARLNIGAGEPQMQADWEVNDETSAAYIKNRTHYKETQIVLPETTTVTVPDRGLDQYITVPFTSPITPGKSYIVNLNGTTYNTTAKKVEAEDNSTIVLGNIGLMPGFEDTGEPFYINITEGYLSSARLEYYAIAYYGGSDPISISISEVIIHKLPYEYIHTPDWNAQEGQPGYIKNLPLVDSVSDILPETTLENVDGEMGFTEPLPGILVAGNTYVVTYNGVDYICEAIEFDFSDGQGIAVGVMLGNTDVITNEDMAADGPPFIFGWLPPEGAALLGAHAILIPLDDSTVATIRIRGGKMIDPKVLPDSIPWEEPSKVILPKTTFIENEGHQGLYPNSIVANETYNITWNGTTYKCVAKLFSANGDTAIVCGNINVMLGGESTGEPFVIIVPPSAETVEQAGYNIAIQGIDSSSTEEVTVSISTDPVIHKMPLKYHRVPDWNASENEEGHILNRTHWETKSVVILPETTFTEVNTYNPITTLSQDIELGKEYPVTYNGVEYKCVAQSAGENALFTIALTDVSVDSGEEPTFAIMKLTPLGEQYLGAPYVIAANDNPESITVKIAIGNDEIHKLDQKFLPDYNWEAFEGEEGHILNRTHYEEPVKQILEQTTITSMDGSPISVPMELIEGKEYTVIVNGVEYDCVAEPTEIPEGIPEEYKIIFENSIQLKNEVIEIIEFNKPFNGAYGIATHLKYTELSEDPVFEIKTKYAIKKLDPKFLPEISSVEVDATLSVEGMAADAKAVGDAISVLNGKIGDTAVSEQINTAIGNITYPVNSVNGKTGEVVLNASDVGALPNTTEIPSIVGLASETYVDTKVAELVNSAPETLNTLNELATALGNDPNFATTVATKIGTKANANDLISHIGNKSNPHSVTAEQIGAMSASDPTGTGSFSMNRKADTTIGNYSHAEGLDTTASGYRSHAEGVNTIASGNDAHAEGGNTIAGGDASHAEGRETSAYGTYSHAEGFNVNANGYAAHAEGQYTGAHGTTSHAEGEYTNALAKNSHAEGYLTYASGARSHAEGMITVADGVDAHAEGRATLASGYYAHAEGLGDYFTIQISGEANAKTYSIQNTTGNPILTRYFIVFGGACQRIQSINTENSTITLSQTLNSTNAISNGNARVYTSIAYGAGSHVEGCGTYATEAFQHVQGKYNTVLTKYAHIVGNGSSEENRSNAHTLDWDGNAWYQGNVYVGGDSQDDANKLATESYVNEKIETIEAPVNSVNGKTGEVTLTASDIGAMSSNNPVGTGSFSMGRKEGTSLYQNSFALGVDVTANSYALATGLRTVASGLYSSTEGYQTTASGMYSHAEGSTTIASGMYSHAEGYSTKSALKISGEANTLIYNVSSMPGNLRVGEGITFDNVFAIITEINRENSTITLSKTLSSEVLSAVTAYICHGAFGNQSHVEGKNATASGESSHAEGTGTIAASRSQHVQGEYNIEDAVSEYTYIVGNGEFDYARSNAHTLDWDGNAWYSGDVYVGSTSGTNKDEGSKKLATEEYVNNLVRDSITLVDQVTGQRYTICMRDGNLVSTLAT